ncbi:winged helix-turn-helix domain-containing protein [Micromonospora sp. WMMD1082]|uniref:winged helix-turn-helix domain-containing protein n=1 Tax=Micromonospora sp. WMMD1082 TaxID=3016104 RepID=UPI0024172400|nr:winged helix-turn-helix domain-containing protein [Micromonospora sp. WMMD1082]MDG4797377.1 winged helix-turn-helix domain-containing protein [Micromonospora sp. WMMD1082]
MSVVTIGPRQHPPRRTNRARLVRPRTGPTLTITVDLTSGSVSPRLNRLLELLSEIAESGEGRLSQGEVVDRAPGEDPHAVRILTGPRTVRQGDREIPLTRIEYDLLLFLAERPRRVFTRLQLLNSVWGYDHAVARTVDVHVRRLRAKLGVDAPLLTTVHGIGYRLADDARVTIES